MRQRWALSDTKRWREEYNKHAKTFVRVGDAPTDRSWSEPVGTCFRDRAPVRSDEARRGLDLTVLVLREGSTIPGFSVGLIREGGAREGDAEDGRGRRRDLALRRRGSLVPVRHALRAMPGPDLEWESHFDDADGRGVGGSIVRVAIDPPRPSACFQRLVPTRSSAPPQTIAAIPAHCGTVDRFLFLTASSTGPIFASCVFLGVAEAAVGEAECPGDDQYEGGDTACFPFSVS